MAHMKILGAACIAAYLLAMCLPAVVTKGYHTTYLLHGWEVTYICGLFSFAPSMNLEDRAPFILGTLSNLLFLFGLTLFVVGVLLHRSRPHYVVICWIALKTANRPPATSSLYARRYTSVTGFLEGCGPSQPLPTVN
jgi:hypothetical protein